MTWRHTPGTPSNRLAPDEDRTPWPKDLPRCVYASSHGSCPRPVMEGSDGCEFHTPTPKVAAEAPALPVAPLNAPPATDAQTRRAAALSMRGRGFTADQIAARLKVSTRAVHRYLSEGGTS